MMEPHDRERLLDHFPLTDNELDHLLSIYHDTFKVDQTILLKPFFSKYVSQVTDILRHAVKSVFVMNRSASDPLQNEFLEACVSLLGRRGDRFLIDAIFDAAVVTAETPMANGCNGTTAAYAETPKLMDLLYRMSYISLMQNHEENYNPLLLKPTKGWLQAPTNESKISRVVFKDWVQNKASQIQLAISAVFQIVLLGPEVLGKPSRVLSLPSAAKGMTSQHAIQLAAMGLGGNWYPVYNSQEHGLSFPVFQEALLSYTGSTVILLQTSQGDIFGYYSQIPWRVHHKWFSEEGDSFLFSLYPRWSMYPLNQDGLPKRYHQFLHSPISNNKIKDNLIGLGIGGIAADTPRLHITASLERCTATPYDNTFEQGSLLAEDDNSFFDIEHIQVFAVEDSEDVYLKNVASGKLHAALREEARQRVAQVDRKQFVEDFVSGAFMNTLYQHREQTRGRASFCAEEDGKGYFLEGKRPSHASFDLDDSSDTQTDIDSSNYEPLL